ncbi:MAG TPA: wax ester/triacylglycerol synthase domain-containing protein, partial [Ornithinibacter sp.]|nr:wax ester/triacylglycerol synthase domain-containing protein [Ornithinibacter sp.]
MDRPNNLMIVDSVLWFDEPVDWDRIVNVLRKRLVGRFPAFSQHPVDPPIPLGLPHWEDDPDFDIERHMIRARLPEPGDDAALQAYLEEQIHRPFDRQHPLWEYHFIDGYRGGCAIMPRFHHALGDGAALTEVLLSTTDAAPDDDLRPDPKGRTTPGHGEPHDEHHGGLLGAAAWVAGTAGSAARGALHLLSELPHL